MWRALCWAEETILLLPELFPDQVRRLREGELVESVLMKWE